MQDEAEALNEGFISRVTQGRPIVRLKIAASIDGATAMECGESQWITSEEARRDALVEKHGFKSFNYHE